MDTEVTNDLTTMPEDDETRTVFWQHHIDTWRDASLTQRAYARQHGLSIARFTYWKNKFYANRSVTNTNFVPVRLAESRRPVRLIHPSGVVIECSAGTEVSWLRSLLGLVDAS